MSLSVGTEVENNRYLPLATFDDVTKNSNKTPVIKIFQGTYNADAEKLMM